MSTITNIKFKRPYTSNNYNHKVNVKGIDKIIKENLKKNKNKEEIEIIRKHLQEYKLK